MDKKHIKNLRWQLPMLVGIGILLIVLLIQTIIPLEKVRVGECGGVEATRLSLLTGGKEKINEAKQEALDLRENKRKITEKTGLMPGCSKGPAYELHLLF